VRTLGVEELELDTLSQLPPEAVWTLAVNGTDGLLETVIVAVGPPGVRTV
jgi:hypothetical protein